MDCIIFDIGGYFTKYGIDKLKIKRTNVCYYKKNSFEIGYEAKNCLNIKPISNGKVIDWDELQKLIEKIVYYDLEISNTSNYSVINIFPTDEPKFKEFFLNKLNFAKYAYLSPITATLLEKRKKTALIIDIGHDLTKITPIYDGYEILSGVFYSTFTGKQIDKALKIKSFKKKNLDWNQNIFNKLKNDDIDLVKDIKKSISKVDINIRKELLNNIVISGLIFNKNIKLHIENSLNIKIDINKCSKDLKWYGGKKVSNTSIIRNKWLYN